MFQTGQGFQPGDRVRIGNFIRAARDGESLNESIVTYDNTIYLTEMLETIGATGTVRNVTTSPYRGDTETVVDVRLDSDTGAGSYSSWAYLSRDLIPL